MSNAHELVQAMSSVLTPLGYIRRKRTWCLNRDGFVSVVTLFEPPWGGARFFIDVGLYLKPLGTLEFPEEHKCQVRQRLSFVTENREALERALDLSDKTIGHEERQQMVSQALYSYCDRYVKPYASLVELANGFRSGKLDGLTVDIQAQSLLESF